MSLIMTPAYLYVCQDCGKHGHIVLPDGTTGKKVYSREGVYEELHRLKLQGKVDDYEIEHIKETVPQPWPRLSDDAPPMIVAQCEMINELEEELECMTPEEREGLDDLMEGVSIH